MPENSILPQEVKNKYSKEIAFLRKCAQSGRIKISNHCYEQVSQRHIRIGDVFDSIKKGVVIEVQSYERDTKVLFQDCTNNPPYFFVAVAIKSSMGLCVTAYLPDPDIWVLEPDNQWRRK